MRNLTDTKFWKRVIRLGVVDRLRPERLVAALRDRGDGFDKDVWLAVHGRVVRLAMAEMRLHRRVRGGRPSISRADPGLTRGERRTQPAIPRIEVDDIVNQAHVILLDVLLYPSDPDHRRLVDVLATNFGLAIKSIVARAIYRLERTQNDTRRVRDPDLRKGGNPNRRVTRRLSSLDHGSALDEASNEDAGPSKVDYVRLLAMVRERAVARGVFPEFSMRRRRVPFNVIGTHLGVSGQTVRNRLAAFFQELEMDPDYLNRRRAQSRARRALTSVGASETSGPGSSVVAAAGMGAPGSGPQVLASAISKGGLVPGTPLVASAAGVGSSEPGTPRTPAA